MNRSVFFASLLLLTGACRHVSWVQDGSGRLSAVHKSQVQLPGLSYLTLGAGQHEVIAALRRHGFECSEESATSRAQACVRPPGPEEPTGGVVMLEFHHGVLTGVQAQLHPPDDGTQDPARRQFDQLQEAWSRSFGPPKEVQRPGVTAMRHNLPDGTALFLVRFDGEPTLIAEHLQARPDTTIRIPAAPR